VGDARRLRKKDRVNDPAGAETIELRADMNQTEPLPERRRSRFWPEVSGALAIGLCVLAVVVLGFQVVAWIRGMPGPGLLTVGGHVFAAVVAVLVQRLADRMRGWHAAAAVTGVLLVAAVTLWIFWWA
jgi:lipopolysaccharide export LptBFGC system permease protein LptF